MSSSGQYVQWETVTITWNIHLPCNHKMWSRLRCLFHLAKLLCFESSAFWLVIFVIVVHLFLIISFWVPDKNKMPRSWNCLWWWIGKRILIPLPIQRMSWFMLWRVVEDLFTLMLKLSIYFNDWCTVILNDTWNFFQFSFNQYLGPCPFVRVCARCFHAYCLGAGFSICFITACLLFRKGTNAGKGESLYQNSLVP